MSIERKALAGGVPANIRFYYDTEKVFNSLSLRTSYRAKMIKDQAGADQVEDVAITSEEKNIILEILEEGVSDIFIEVLKITKGAASPIFFNTAFTPTGGTEIMASGGIILDNVAFDLNTLNSIDSKILSCIRYFILSKWYISCGLGDDAKLNIAEYQNYLRQVKSLVFKLKPLML